MILVDTSVWVNHLRRRDPGLAGALDAGQVVMHPFVLGEMACGHLRQRTAIIALMRDLPFAPVATDAEALEFIDRRRLMGRGIGYIDVHLLASAALLGGARLWTRDKRLADVAAGLGVNFGEGTT